MKFGKVEQELKARLEKKGGLLFNLIDVFDYSLENAVKTAKECEEGGADAVLVGGSIGVQGSALDTFMKEINNAVSLPTILFPGNIGTVSRYADAIYYMYMINSRSTYWLGEAQTIAAPVVKMYDIEAIPTCYIVVSPGETVGWVGDARLIPRNKPKLTAACALAGQYMGAHFILTDCGSNAPAHIPLEHVKAVSSSINDDVVYVAAGGIKTPDQAKKIISAGANVIQIGTAIEGKDKVKEKVSKFAKAVHI